MKKILLACCAGMSSSLLVKRMEQYAKEHYIECVIEAHAISEAKEHLNDFDICLIAPQVRDQFQTIKSLSPHPVLVIDTRAYGLIDGKAVMETVLETLK